MFKSNRGPQRHDAVNVEVQGAHKRDLNIKKE